MKSLLILVALGGTAVAAPIERRLYSNQTEASTFLWNDWNKFVENYHPNYIADDDASTAWVEGATGSGAGQWVRVELTPLEQTTKIRLKIRNGYQKSSALFKANARAKEVTVRLLPGKVEKKVTLTDTEGWQEITVETASATVRAVELAVGSVYEGTKYPDLCISDVQIFATSETKDNPAFEKGKRDDLKKWRAARIAAAKAITNQKIALPTYPAYAVTTTDREFTTAWDTAEMVKAAAADPTFTKEWKDALATATTVMGSLDTLPRAQLSPKTKQKLVEVDGITITTLEQTGSFEGAWHDEASLRLPMMGTVAAMYVDQLRVLDVKDKQTITQFSESSKLCKGDVAWVARSQTKEATGPSAVRALIVGRCGKVEGREGSYVTNTFELLVYDANGRLALVAGTGHIEAYRWTVDNGKAMLAGGRSLLAQGKVIEATKRSEVAVAPAPTTK